ncbi:MAG: glycosyltransferase family 4 protein [Trueperaceae bacterium]|nr:glycosyltransferase family 4 protein [Trueperaceae bacterium]
MVATRLAGTDGVSLESDKLAEALRARGFDVAEAAGELDGPGHLVPEMHFADPVAAALGRRCFAGEGDDPTLEDDVRARATEIADRLRAVFEGERPDLLVVQNAWAIPMQLPLAVALADLVAERRIPTLSHEHDYWWERERFARPKLRSLLDAVFPFHAAHVVHLAIHTGAVADLRARRGIDARWLPNVMDFDRPFGELDDFNADFREAIDLAGDRRLFLQPTRVVPRKGIELAIDLLHGLGDPRDALVITHHAGDEGLDYLRGLERRADGLGVDLRYVANRVGETRADTPGGKRYALADAYPHADLVTYPSLYEGFGNALLEAVAARRPVFVNRYPVYARDLAPAGFRFVEIDGAVTDAAVAAVAGLLADPERVARDAAHNHAIARARFGLDTLGRVLDAALADLGVTP